MLSVDREVKMEIAEKVVSQFSAECVAGHWPARVRFTP
jgi:hypothetical protein